MKGTAGGRLARLGNSIRPNRIIPVLLLSNLLKDSPPVGLERFLALSNGRAGGRSKVFLDADEFDVGSGVPH